MKAAALFRKPLQSLIPFAAFVSCSAWAHPGHDEHVSGFVAGIAHPLFGADHLLAMLAVGLLAARLGGRAVWGVPLAFMLSMALGALLAFAGIRAPFVEPLAAASVLMFGLALCARIAGRGPAAGDARAPTLTFVPAVAVAMLVASFAIFHGLAHGAELPAHAAPIDYFAGFLLSTGLIHAAGIALALLIGAGLNRQRAAGVPLALAGVWLLAGAF